MGALFSGLQIQVVNGETAASGHAERRWKKVEEGEYGVNVAVWKSKEKEGEHRGQCCNVSYEITRAVTAYIGLLDIPPVLRSPEFDVYEVP